MQPYPFEANLAKLIGLCGMPDSDIQLQAAKRITASIDGKPYRHLCDGEFESLAYVAAAMLLSQIGDKKLTATYIEHDMKAYVAESEDDNRLMWFANKRYGLGVDVSKPTPTISLAGYLHCIPPRTKKWKLSGRVVSGGRVDVEQDELNELAGSAIRDELVKKFNNIKFEGPASDDAIDAVKKKLSARFVNRGIARGIPPCILHCEMILATGQHLTYNGRFALAAFHGKRGMQPDRIARFFETSPDYNERVTKTQVNGIVGKELMPYSCGTMEQHGLCKRHERCGSIKNPLAYV